MFKGGRSIQFRLIDIVADIYYNTGDLSAVDREISR
jgi:hypothetical protein